MELGGTIARERGAQRMSLRTLAARAGVSASTVKRIEDGTRDATVDVAERLLAALGLALAVRSAGPVAPSLAEVAAALARHAADDPAGRIRLLARMRRQVMALDPPARRAWLAAPTGAVPLSREWLATLAAVVEWIASDTPGALHPLWTTGTRLPSRWWPVRPGHRAEQIWAETPEAFRMRNVAVGALAEE